MSFGVCDNLGLSEWRRVALPEYLISDWEMIAGVAFLSASKDRELVDECFYNRKDSSGSNLTFKTTCPHHLS